MLRVNEENISWKKGMNIQDILEVCEYTYHSLLVKVDGKLVKRKDWEDFEVPDDVEVQVIHMMTGG